MFQSSLEMRQKNSEDAAVTAASTALLQEDLEELVAFTVLDVLGYLDEIPVCVGYDIDGEVTTEFPVTHLLEKAKPVYEVLPGWKCDIRGIKNYEDLPENCRKYIEFIEEHIGYPITMVSNGPARTDIIYRKKG